jgi:hypothetical protein
MYDKFYLKESQTNSASQNWPANIYDAHGYDVVKIEAHAKEIYKGDDDNICDEHDDGNTWGEVNDANIANNNNNSFQSCIFHPKT